MKIGRVRETVEIETSGERLEGRLEPGREVRRGGETWREDLVRGIAAAYIVTSRITARIIVLKSFSYLSCVYMHLVGYVITYNC